MAAFRNDEFGRDQSRCSVAAPQGVTRRLVDRATTAGREDTI